LTHINLGILDLGFWYLELVLAQSEKRDRPENEPVKGAKYGNVFLFPLLGRYALFCCNKGGNGRLLFPAVSPLVKGTELCQVLFKIPFYRILD
ncbi:unnamed protein product, partial [Dovyalis caffra]